MLDKPSQAQDVFDADLSAIRALAEDQFQRIGILLRFGNLLSTQELQQRTQAGSVLQPI